MLYLICLHNSILFLDSERNRSPLLIPYPNYEMNQIPSNKEDYSRIIHAVRMSVDECDRLWVIDMRKVNDTMWYGDPQILIIDLKTDRVVRKFTIGPKLRRVDGETWFINVVTDMDPKSCNQAFAYIPDVRWGLVVYSFENNTAWRLQHHFFYFDPVSTLIRSSGLRLGRTDGVFGVALSERRPDGYRTLFFHSLASTRIFSVDTNILKSNITVAETYDEYHGRGQRPHGMNAAAMTIDLESGVLLYSLVNQDGIGCWNPRRFEYLSNDTSAVLVTDPVTLQYPADLKVDANSNVWVVSNKMMKFRFRQKDLNLTEVNYRVFMAPVDELIKDTVCQLTRENYLTTMRPKTSDIKRLKTVVQAIQYK